MNDSTTNRKKPFRGTALKMMSYRFRGLLFSLLLLLMNHSGEGYTAFFQFSATEQYEDFEVNYYLLDSLLEVGDAVNYLSNCRQLQEQCEKAAAWTDYILLIYYEADYYRSINQVEKVRRLMEKAESGMNTYAVDIYEEDFAIIFSDYGSYNYFIGDYDRGVAYFEKAIDINSELLSRAKDSTEEVRASYRYYLGNEYQNLGAVLGDKGDYAQAIDYYQRSIELLQDSTAVLAQVYNNIALDFQRAGNLKKAQFSYETSIDLLAALPEADSVKRINFYHNYATFFNKQKAAERAEYFLEKAAVLIPNRATKLQADHLSISGGTDLLQGKIKSAKQKWEAALEKRVSIYGFHHRETSYTYRLLGEFIHAKQKDHKAALSYYQKAIAALVRSFKDSIDYKQNPDLYGDILNRLDLLDLLSLKARSLEAVQSIEASKATLELAVQLIDSIRFNYVSAGSKYALLNKAMPIYEQAIDLSYKTGNLDWAFELMERSKATVLLESINNSEAQAFAGFPKPLLEKERSMKIEMAYYERLLHEDDTNLAFKTLLFDLKKAYQDSLQNWEREYTAYYELKYQLDYPSIDLVQERLVDVETAQLEYFTGDSSIFVFLITQDTICLQKLPRTSEFTSVIQTYRAAISQPDPSNFSAYTQSAWKIYEQYVAEILSQLSPGIQKLLLIPDGQLNYIPFQALITSPVPISKSRKARFDTLSYLVSDYAISYAYSSTLSLKMQTQHLPTSVVLGAFAPIFDSSAPPKDSSQKKQLQKLAYSEQEAKQICKMWSGKNYLREDANIEELNTQLGTLGILHFSTHAMVDDENPGQSKIFFHEAASLTLNEIYNLESKALLTVLSACETGTGEFQRGEGLLSLARGFMYAGCPSLVTSLWQVNDHATSNLMIEFYRQLKKGQDKSTALQMAQINNIRASSSERTHPYYWAAFIQIGDPSPLTPPFNYGLLFWIGLGSVLALGLFYTLKKRVENEEVIVTSR